MAGRPKGGSAKHDSDISKELPKNIENTNVEENDNSQDAIREAIKDMLSGNLKNLPSWLEEIGKEDPIKALNIFKDFAEYVLPKQQRTDNKQSSDNAITVVFDLASKQEEDTERIKSSAKKPGKTFKLEDLI